MGFRCIVTAIICAMMVGCTPHTNELPEPVVQKYCEEVLSNYLNIEQTLSESALASIKESELYSEHKWDTVSCNSIRYLLEDDTYVCLCSIYRSGDIFTDETPITVKVLFTLQNESIATAEVYEYVELF